MADQLDELLARQEEAAQKKQEAPSPTAADKGNANVPAEAPATAKVPDRQTIIVQASHYMLEEQKITNELLKVISNKLLYLVEQLTN